MNQGMITPKRHRKNKYVTSEKHQNIKGDNDQLATPITGSSNKVVKLRNKDGNLEVSNKDMSRHKNITERLLDCSTTNLVEQKQASVSSYVGLGSPDVDYARELEDKTSCISRVGTPIREEFDSCTVSEPKTPENKTTLPAFEEDHYSHSDSDSDVEIRRINHLKNPFLSSSSPKLLNPFVSNKSKSDVDYANTIEMVDRRTGKKFFQPLTDAQKNLKPKRLHFDQFSKEKSSDKNGPVNNDIMNRFDRLVNIGSKKSLNFEIFNDTVKDPK